MTGPLPGVPVCFDGTEREFRLTFGAIKRLRDRHQINLLRLDAESLANEAADVLGAILFECVKPKPDDFEAFLDAIDLRQAGDIAAVINQALGGNTDRPIEATETPVASLILEDSGPSLESGSESVTPNSGT